MWWQYVLVVCKYTQQNLSDPNYVDILPTYFQLRSEQRQQRKQFFLQEKQNHFPTVRTHLLWSIYGPLYGVKQKARPT